MAKITMNDGNGGITEIEGSTEELREILGQFGVEVPEKAEADEVKAEAPSVKAGDKVRLLSGGGEFPLRGYYNGEVYVVKNAEFDHMEHRPKLSLLLVGGEGTQGFALPEQVEVVEEKPTEEPPTGFVKIPNELAKEGDLIRFVDTEDDYITVGNIYEVTAIDRDGDPELLNDADAETVAVTSEEFEIYRKPIEGAPQVGDKILVTAVLPISFGYYDNGDVLTVKRIDSDGDTYVNGRILHLKRREFVIISRQFERPAEAPAKCTTQFEVGDIVRNEGTLHVVEGVHEPGYIDADEGISISGGKWRYERNCELVAKASDRRDISRKDR